MNLYYAQESKKLKNNFYYYITTTIKANFSMQKNKPWMSVRVIKNLADLFFLKSLGDHTKWKRKK